MTTQRLRDLMEQRGGRRRDRRPGDPARARAYGVRRGRRIASPAPPSSSRPCVAGPSARSWAPGGTKDTPPAVDDPNVVEDFPGTVGS